MHSAVCQLTPWERGKCTAEKLIQGCSSGRPDFWRGELRSISDQNMDYLLLEAVMGRALDSSAGSIPCSVTLGKLLQPSGFQSQSPQKKITNNNNCHLLNSYSLLGAVLRTFFTFSFVLTIALWSRCYYYSHLKETEMLFKTAAQKDN